MPNALPSSLLCPFIAANMIRRQLFQFHHHCFLNEQSNGMPGDDFNGYVKIIFLDCAVSYSENIPDAVVQ